MSSFSSVASEIGTFLAGKKTYILSGITLAADAYLLYTGQETAADAAGVAAAALGFSTLRHGATTDAIKAATAIIATRDPKIAANPDMAAVNGIAKAIISGALDHAQEAATVPSPIAQLTPTMNYSPTMPAPASVHTGPFEQSSVIIASGGTGTGATFTVNPALSPDSKHTTPLDQPAAQPQAGA